MNAHRVLEPRRARVDARANGRGRPRARLRRARAAAARRRADRRPGARSIRRVARPLPLSPASRSPAWIRRSSSQARSSATLPAALELAREWGDRHGARLRRRRHRPRRRRAPARAAARSPTSPSRSRRTITSRARRASPSWSGSSTANRSQRSGICTIQRGWANRPTDVVRALGAGDPARSREGRAAARGRLGARPARRRRRAGSESLDVLRAHGYDGWLTVEWEKRWHPELAEPELALPHELRALRALIG